MEYFIDGWPIEAGTPDNGRVATAGTSVAGYRPDVEDHGFRLPRRRGKTPIPDRVGPQQFVLEVACAGDRCSDDGGEMAALAYVAEVHSRLPEHRLVLLRRIGAGRDMFSAAEVLAATEVSRPDVQAINRLNMKIVFTLPSGAWFESVEKTATVPAGASTITALLGGSAAMEPVWVITGNGGTTSVEIVDEETGAWWRLVGSVDPGVQVTVDPLAHTAVDAFGEDRADLLTTGTNPFYLSPGARVVQTRNQSQPTTIRARRAWYE